MRLPLPLVILSLCSCPSGPDPTGRSGEPFARRFSDPGTLLRADDVAGLRRILSDTPLPAEDAHHQRLVETLAAVDELRLENLLLFTEAVSVWAPEERARAGNKIDRWPRGSGTYAGVVDRLLLDGVDKLTDLDVERLGRLLERAQSAAGLEALAAVTLDRFDDGSNAALRQILGGFSDPQRAADLVLEILLPAGSLEGDRRWVALASIRQDQAFGRVARVLIRGPEGLDLEALVRGLELAAGDTAREKLLSSAMGVRPIDEVDEVCRVLGAFPFEDGRVEALRFMRSVSSRRWSQEEWGKVVAEFSFDSSRLGVVEEFTGYSKLSRFADVLPITAWFLSAEARLGLLRRTSRRPGLAVRPEDLAPAARLFANGLDRKRLLETLQPRVAGEVTVADMRSVLEALDGENLRLVALGMWADDLRGGSEEERRGLLSFFGDEELELRARRLLEL